MQETLIGDTVDVISSAADTTVDALTGSSTATPTSSSSSSTSNSSSSESSFGSSSSSSSGSPTTAPNATTFPPEPMTSKPSTSSGDESLSMSTSVDSSANTDIDGVASGSSSTSSTYSTDASGDAVVQQAKDGGSGLSAGSIAAIAVAALALLVTLLGFWYSCHKKQSRKSESTPSSLYRTTGGVPTEERDQATEVFSPFHTKDLESSSNSESQTLPAALWENEIVMSKRIPLERLGSTKLVSSGGHGLVYRGTFQGEVVAIKRLLPDKQKKMHEVNAFLGEIKLMASIEHPRVVRFIGVAWDSLSDLSAVSEFMFGGDLHSLLTRFEQTEHRPHGFDLDKARIALQTAQALAYLHSLDPIVLHRDLKSMNILLTPTLQAKITDFGVSRQWSLDTLTAGVGSVLWMAPEVMLGEHYDASADIFSFGIVLSELDSHLPPYRETWAERKVSDTARLQMISSGQLRVEFSANAPQDLVDLGLACVDLDPTARPSANQVLYRLQGIVRKYEGYTL